jgi:hypothetical protein
VLPGGDTEADDGGFTQRLGSLEPVQALDQNKASAVLATRIGVCWPSVSMLCAIASTRFKSSVLRRAVGT